MNEVILPEWTAEDFFDRIGSYSWFMQCKVPLVRIHSIALRTICEEHGARKAKHQPLAFPELRVVEKSGSDLAKKVVYFLVAVHAFIEKLKSLLVSSRKEEFDNPLLLENLFIAEYGGLSTLEVILFDEEVVASLGETSLDILEYCYIKIWEARRCDEQDKTVLGLDMMALTTLRSLVVHRERCPLAFSRRVFMDYDIPMLLVDMIELKPWNTTSEEGAPLAWFEGRWVPNSGIIYPVEGCVWISLLYLVLSPEVSCGGYVLDSYRRDKLLRLRHHITEMRLQELPALSKLKTFLEQLNLNASLGCSGLPRSGEAPKALSPFAIVEVRDSLRDRLMKRDIPLHKLDSTEYMQVDWELKEVFSEDRMVLKELGFKAQTDFCQVCKAACTNRCSRCKSVFYCGNECQRRDWASHKKMCM